MITKNNKFVYCLKLIFIFYILPTVVIIIGALLFVPNSINLVTASFQKNWIEIIDQQIKFKRSAYNELFLPNTQTGKFNYDEVKLINDLSSESLTDWAHANKFFLNTYKDNLYTVNSVGNIYVTNLSDFIKLKVDKSVGLQSDFDHSFKVLDFIIVDNSIIISAFKIENNCAQYTLFIDELTDSFNSNFSGVFEELFRFKLNG